jgi:hypothetical protein
LVILDEFEAGKNERNTTFSDEHHACGQES